MSTIQPCMWGARLAVPLAGPGWRATMDDVRAFVGAVAKAKPTGSKGTYMKKASMTSTMASPQRMAGKAPPPAPSQLVAQFFGS